MILWFWLICDIWNDFWHCLVYDLYILIVGLFKFNLFGCVNQVMIIVCVNLQWRRWRPSREVWLIPTRIWAIGIEETHVLPTGQEFFATTHHYLMAIFMFKNCMIQSFWFLSIPCSISDWMEISSFFWFSCFFLSPICGEIFLSISQVPSAFLQFTI